MHTTMSAEEIQRLRSAMGRWACLNLELACLKARGVIDSDESKTFLLKLGLLEQGGWPVPKRQPDRHAAWPTRRLASRQPGWLAG